MVQPFQARSHCCAAAVRHVRISHGVTRRETDVHPGGGHAFQRLPLMLGLGALRCVGDQAACRSSRARRLERLQDGRRVERVRSEEHSVPRSAWPSPGQRGRLRRKSRQPGTPLHERRGWVAQPAASCCAWGPALLSQPQGLGRPTQLTSLRALRGTSRHDSGGR